VAQDAVKFPLIGSAVLVSLFILFKVLPKDLVNMVLTLYFVVLGAWVITATIFPFVNVLFPLRLQESLYEYKGFRIPFFVPVRFFLISFFLTFDSHRELVSFGSGSGTWHCAQFCHSQAPALSRN
jgi:Signal peptide peptidase